MPLLFLFLYEGEFERFHKSPLIGCMEKSDLKYVHYCIILTQIFSTTTELFIKSFIYWHQSSFNLFEFSLSDWKKKIIYTRHTHNCHKEVSYFSQSLFVLNLFLPRLNQIWVFERSTAHWSHMWTVLFDKNLQKHSRVLVLRNRYHITLSWIWLCHVSIDDNSVAIKTDESKVVAFV